MLFTLKKQGSFAIGGTVFGKSVAIGERLFALAALTADVISVTLGTVLRSARDPADQKRCVHAVRSECRSAVFDQKDYRQTRE
jgi:hypothetical protein